MQTFTKGLFGAVAFLLAATVADAQTIAGLVRDESGAMMPGVSSRAKWQ
jgi:hypothetical protein